MKKYMYQLMICRLIITRIQYNIVTNIFALTILTLITISSVSANSNSSMVVNNINEKFVKFTCNYGSAYPNCYAFYGEDGILIIDTGIIQTAEKLNNFLSKLGNGEIKYIINTHLHPDHIGANDHLSTKQTLIISHRKTREWLKGFYGQIRNVQQSALPDMVFDSTLTIYFNNEEIRLLYFPGHTDNDIIVYFPNSKLVFMGDLLLSNGFPSVEFDEGGDINKYLLTLRTIINYFPEDTRYFPGHGKEYAIEELRRYYNFVEKSVKSIQKGLLDGKNIDQMRNEKLLNEWKIKVVDGGADANYWIGAVAGSLLDENSTVSIAEPLLSILNTSNAKIAINRYIEIKDSNLNDFYFDENALNILGYYLLGKNRVKEAIDIFELNVTEYPEAFNVYDSLGEAYMIYGKYKKAIINYKKSLALNQQNDNAIKMLEKLNYESEK